jgi:hypothetical protein
VTHTSCTVDELELIRLLDGELTENLARELRDHVATCPACGPRLRTLQGLLEQLGEMGPEPTSADDAAFIDAVERRLPERARRPAAAGRRRRPLVAALSVVAAAAAIALWMIPRSDRSVLTPRGKSATPWHDLVAVDLGAVDGGQASAPARPLGPGVRLAAGDGIAVRAQNRGQRSPVYLMVFAVDAAGAVHWIQPLWSDPAANPRSVSLLPGEPPLLEVVAPEAPAPGPLRVVSLLSLAPLDVRTVEGLLAAGRSLTDGREDRYLRSVELSMTGPGH